MKNLAVIALCVVFVAVVSARPDEDGEKFPSDYDNIDLDAILANDRARKGHIHCFKTGEKCTPDAEKLRKVIPSALQDGCAKCTEVHKTQVKKVLDYTLKNHPEEFKELEDVFDKDHKFRTLHAEKLKAEGIALPD